MEGLSTPDALVLFGHGSRDPAWHTPMNAIAQRAGELSPGLRVVCAYLELTAPDLPTAAAMLAGTGSTHVRIVPVFLGMGRHAREDLPALVDQVRSQWPDVRFELRSAIGTDERLTELVARLALEEPGGGGASAP